METAATLPFPVSCPARGRTVTRTPRLAALAAVVFFTRHVEWDDAAPGPTASA